METFGAQCLEEYNVLKLGSNEEITEEMTEEIKKTREEILGEYEAMQMCDGLEAKEGLVTAAMHQVKKEFTAQVHFHFHLASFLHLIF